MRKAFCGALLEAAANPNFVFLTGDLGFMALEPLAAAMGERFINAGVAEQNMVGVGAGLARTGLRPWLYSIAPFIYARPFEQIRNDVCLHDLPVTLVGNGGGYGYGVMGSTHHALEDYGILLTLANMRVFMPAFDEDVAPVVKRIFEASHPAYLRLGLSEKPADMEMPAYAPWRRLLRGDRGCVLAAGPLGGGIAAAAAALDPAARPNIWLVTELPLANVPEEFLADVRRSDALVVAEEHVANGGLGQMLAAHLAKIGQTPRRFVHRAALGYPSGRYGSQKFHRKECGLDAPSVLAALSEASAS